MAWEWVAPLATGMTALAGIAATYFTARHNSLNGMRIFEAERNYRAEEATILERKTTYARILHAFEEFYFTLFLLQKRGYGGQDMEVAITTTDVHDLLTRNLEMDLAIQNTERELELLAPLHIVKACRHAFHALRMETLKLTDAGDLSPEPYDTLLAKIVVLMRTDLEGEWRLDSSMTERSIEQEVREIFALNAPASGIRLRMATTEDGRQNELASELR